MAIQTRLIGEQFKNFGVETEAYYFYLTNIPRNFFQLLFITLAFTVAISGRDFWFMLNSEKEARKKFSGTQGVDSDSDFNLQQAENSSKSPREERSFHIDFSPLKDKPERAVNAILPILTFGSVAIVGIFLTGYFNTIERNISQKPSFQNMVSEANTMSALIWAVFTSSFLLILLLLAQRVLLLGNVFSVYTAGLSSYCSAVFTLGMAFTLGDVCNELQLGKWIAFGLKGSIPPKIIPFLTSLLSGMASFANGSSIGTMVVMFPIALPLIFTLAPNDVNLQRQTVASILSGSVFGDACSPFSDTVVLSALVAGIPSISHAKTQFPYALLAFFVSLVFGDLFVSLGVYPFFVGLIIGVSVIIGLVLLFGRRSGTYNAKQGLMGTSDDVSFAQKLISKIGCRISRSKDYQPI